MLKFVFYFVLFLALAHGSSHFTPASSSSFLSKTSNLQKVEESTSDSLTSFVLCPVLGALLFFFSFPFLWYNERAYVESCHHLKVELLECATLDPYNVSTEHNGNLVYVKGTTSCDENIIDDAFKTVSSMNAIKLIRKAEMYQWRESTHTDKNHTHYTYDKVWDETYHDSTSFNDSSFHRNDSLESFLVRSNEVLAKEVHIGAYLLSDELKKQACRKEAIIPTEEMMRSFVEPSYKYQPKGIAIMDNYIMLRKDQMQNTIGDIRISFYEVKCGPSTVIAQLEGNSFIVHKIESAQADKLRREKSGEVFTDDRGCCNNFCCMFCRLAKSFLKPIDEILWIIEKDVPTKEEAFDLKMQEQQTKRNWFRLLGWCFSWLGICIFFSPLVTILSFIPLIGGILGFIGWWVCLIFALILGTTLSVVVICAAWLFYRPVVCITVIVLTVGLCVGLCLA